MTATIRSVPGSTITISSPMHEVHDSHATPDEFRPAVAGTATTRTVRGTTVPTLIEKLTLADARRVAL